MYKVWHALEHEVAVKLKIREKKIFTKKSTSWGHSFFTLLAILATFAGFGILAGHEVYNIFHLMWGYATTHVLLPANN